MTNRHDFSNIIKMRNNFYILFFLLVCQLILAQKPSIKKANELFACMNSSNKIKKFCKI